jgi:hypothetical protein
MKVENAIKILSLKFTWQALRTNGTTYEKAHKLTTKKA